MLAAIWYEPLMKMMVTMTALDAEQRRRVLLYVADCIIKAKRAEYRRTIRVVRSLQKINCPAFAGIPPERWQGYSDAMNDLLAALRKGRV